MCEQNISRSFLRALSDTIPNGILAVNPQGKIIVMNNIFSQILGLEESEVLGKDIQEVVPRCQLRSVMNSGDPKTKNLYKLNNRIFMADYYPLHSGTEVLGGVAVFEDITKVREVENELEEVTAFKKILEAVLQNAYEGIVIVDHKGEIIMFNGAYADFLGIKPEDAVGKPVEDVIENTRMQNVVKTGIAEIGKLQRIGEHNAVVMRIPIKIEDRVVAGVGKIWFKDLQDMETLFKRLNSLEDELAYYKEELRRTQGGRYSIKNIIGQSSKMKALKDMIEKASRSHSTVLILGESGTGKELIAHAVHNLSSRSHRPFVRINCAAIPENILESELFGYAEGAFTGAQKGGKIGKFELADKGTIFLDEIGDMSFNMQAKLLRFLQEKEFERLGDNRIRNVNVRVIAATNQDLQKKISKGEFREDLYYRLQVMVIEAIPLREKKEDIPLLVNYFLDKFNKEFGRFIRKVNEDTMNTLLLYNWPGNVRQLENVIERAYNLAEGDEITKDALPLYLLERLSPLKEEKSETPLPKAIDEMEKNTIENVLKQVDGNRTQAARLLGITRTSLYQKLKKYGL